MLIFGWGKRTSKIVGQSPEQTCQICGRANRFNLVEIRTWFSLFFIPVIPYETKRFAACPNCANGYVMPSEAFKQAVEAGKTAY